MERVTSEFVLWFVTVEGMSRCDKVANYYVHTANSISAVVDAFMVAVPVHSTHFVFSIAYVFLYLLFS